MSSSAIVDVRKNKVWPLQQGYRPVEAPMAVAEKRPAIAGYPRLVGVSLMLERVVRSLLLNDREPQNDGLRIKRVCRDGMCCVLSSIRMYTHA